MSTYNQSSNECNRFFFRLILASWRKHRCFLVDKLDIWIYICGGGGGRGENAGEGKLRNYSYQLIFSFLHGVDMEKLIMKM